MRERASFASPSADRLRAGARRRPGGRRRRDGGTRVEALAVIRLLKFDPDRVSVSFAEDTCRRIAEPDRTRRYTLTHNDLTQHLTLSVASDFNPDGQADVWSGVFLTIKTAPRVANSSRAKSTTTSQRRAPRTLPRTRVTDDSHVPPRPT